MIIPSEEISHRTDFSILANARGYVDAVEVGVDHGVFAREFLSRFKGNWLFLVDEYQPCQGFPYDRTADLMVATQALMPWHGRFRFIRMRSVDAAPVVATFISPDFVYIDGCHEEAEVAADLRAWWDVLRPNGMLAGHDFYEGHPGVLAAVKQFAEERGLVVRVTHEQDAPPSWYCYKTEPPTLMHKLFTDGESPNPLATPGA